MPSSDGIALTKLLTKKIITSERAVALVVAQEFQFRLYYVNCKIKTFVIKLVRLY